MPWKTDILVQKVNENGSGIYIFMNKIGSRTKKSKKITERQILIACNFSQALKIVFFLFWQVPGYPLDCRSPQTQSCRGSLKKDSLKTGPSPKGPWSNRFSFSSVLAFGITFKYYYETLRNHEVLFRKINETLKQNEVVELWLRFLKIKLETSFPLFL